ncbi:MAG: hypothetical protein MI861_01520, partial [Pirellulales bacterium]|nr:hypothetical protein [Pirellulales bacterium]
YDEKSRAVPVDGTLTIHGFDDRAASPGERVKRFEFTPDQLTRHFSQTDLGASYSVWVPWDAVGGDQRRISLVASFKTQDGKTVQGLPATVVLPGRTKKVLESDVASKFSPDYLKYRQAQATGTLPTSGLTTTTIHRQRIRAGEKINPVPGITIPKIGSPETMVAGTTATPSVDVQMSRTPSRSTILPASAEMPLRR